MAAAKSAEIADADRALFIIDNRNYFAHITLYNLELPPGQTAMVEYRLKEAVGGQGDMICRFQEIATDESGGIFVALNKSPEIAALSDIVVNTLNPLREDHIRDKYLDPTYQKKLDKKQIDYIYQYGFWRLKEFFAPHITLAAVEPPDQAKAAAHKIIWPISDFTCSTIGIFKSGPHGTCTELVGKVVLNG